MLMRGVLIDFGCTDYENQCFDGKYRQLLLFVVDVIFKSRSLVFLESETVLLRRLSVSV